MFFGWGLFLVYFSDGSDLERGWFGYGGWDGDPGGCLGDQYLLELFAFSAFLHPPLFSLVAHWKRDLVGGSIAIEILCRNEVFTDGIGGKHFPVFYGTKSWIVDLIIFE